MVYSAVETTCFGLYWPSFVAYSRLNFNFVKVITK